MLPIRMTRQVLGQHPPRLSKTGANVANSANTAPQPNIVKGLTVSTTTLNPLASPANPANAHNTPNRPNANKLTHTQQWANTQSRTTIDLAHDVSSISTVSTQTEAEQTELLRQLDAAIHQLCRVMRLSDGVRQRCLNERNTLPNYHLADHLAFYRREIERHTQPRVLNRHIVSSTRTREKNQMAQNELMG